MIKIHKPKEETISRFDAWIKKHFDDEDPNNRVAKENKEECVLSDPSNTTGLLLSLRKDRIIPRIVWFAIKRGSITPTHQNTRYETSIIIFNKVSYSTELITGILRTLDTDFGKTPIYQGSIENPLLVLTSELGEVGLIAPIIPFEVEK